MEHEEIRNAAQEYAKRIYGEYYSTRNARNIIIEGFIEGAKWVLVNQWISVDDRLPKDGETVFAIDVNTTDAYVAWYDEKTRQFHDTDGHLIVLTHWMETP